MADDAATIQMIRMLPMVEALHDEAFLLSGQGECEGVDYLVQRLARYAEAAARFDDSGLLQGLAAAPQGQTSPEENLRQVVVATSELAAYLRQRIGIGMMQKNHGNETYNFGHSFDGCGFESDVIIGRGSSVAAKPPTEEGEGA
ncbi:MAG: hypothetical protein WDA75_25150 [Candidatus Latescibacterota bacterium]|jgi:hypothetical protein